jgi:uncharacterized protein (TIGR00725 family)
MPYVAVCGPADPDDPAVLDGARVAGRLLAERGHVVLTGGLGGVMAAAASGASSVGGTTVGLLPGSSRDDGSPGHTVLLPTGLGEMRNALLVRRRRRARDRLQLGHALGGRTGHAHRRAGRHRAVLGPPRGRWKDRLRLGRRGDRRDRRTPAVTGHCVGYYSSRRLPEAARRM